MTGTWSRADARSALRVPTAADHKYSRGVVGVRTGSEDYPGAAVLGVAGAWHAGAGMVRYLGPARAAELVLQSRPETVVVPGRVDAWVIGSGTDGADRSAAETAALAELLAGEVPVVADAGALSLAVGAAAPRVLTPHDVEHDRLRRQLGLAPVDGAEGRADAAVETARALGAVVLLKGATTIAATPDGWVARVDSGTPWLATAGTGDVLAGIVGSLVAQAAGHGAGDLSGRAGLAGLARLAASGAWLHGSAATIAAASLGPLGGPITAGDVAAALPLAIGQALAPA